MALALIAPLPLRRRRPLQPTAESSTDHAASTPPPEPAQLEVPGMPAVPEQPQVPVLPPPQPAEQPAQPQQPEQPARPVIPALDP
jgi:hypothetical protein